MASSVSQLSSIISQSVLTLENICAEKGWTLPQINEPFTPKSEAFLSHPAAAEAANIIAAAALQLAASVLPAPTCVSRIASGHYKSAALRVCVESNVVEILREAGPQGLHVDKIAAKNGLDGAKLGRFMRYLATHHLFREIEPDVFANNRSSSILDTGKSVKEIQANPDNKHDETAGFPALIEHLLDETHKASAYALETMQDPISQFSGETTHAPLNRAFKMDVPIWEWYEQPEQSFRHRRFGVAMRGVASIQPPESILTAFDWKSLSKGDIVVDVGGGLGTSASPIVGQFEHLNVVVQDRAPVVEQARQIWETKMPEALTSGRVKFEAHDFFTPQPIRNASVFLLKHILHDWSDGYAAKILSHLREAATPQTKLLLIDSIVPYACHDPTSEGSEGIPGATSREAPTPLLPNYGEVNDMVYNVDLVMYFLQNSQERTFGHLTTLLKSVGWKIVRVNRTDGASGFLQPVVAIPV